MLNKPEKIKRKLAFFCNENNIRRKEIAQAAGVSTESVRVWFNLNCKTLPSIHALYWLRKSYGLDINALLEQGESKKCD